MSLISWMKSSQGNNEEENSADSDASKENSPLLSSLSRKRKVKEPLKTNEVNISSDEDAEDKEIDSESEHSDYLPDVKISKSADRVYGCGRGVSTPASGSRGRERGAAPKVRGAPGSTKRAPGSGRGGKSEFSTKASQNKFYKKLSGLDKTALINVFRAVIDSGQVSMATIEGHIQSNFDITSIIDALEKEKNAIFKAMPNAWKYGGGSAAYSRNNFAYKRCSSAISAFKKLLRGQVADMRNLDDAEVKCEYVMKAWPIVSAMPQWIGCHDKEKDMMMLLDNLAALFSQAITKVSVDHLRDISDEVEGMASFKGEMGEQVNCEKMADAIELMKKRV